MEELDSFYNDGFGWICRQCEKDLGKADEAANDVPRIFREGESEKSASFPPLAKWTDKTRRYLMCPRCGMTEAVEKS